MKLFSAAGKSWWVPEINSASLAVEISSPEQYRAAIRAKVMRLAAAEGEEAVPLIRQLLGPLFGRFQAEDLAPTIDRVFGLMFRRGRPELGGMPGEVLLDDPPVQPGDRQPNDAGHVEVRCFGQFV
jgi:hypothetical protein